MKDKINIDKVNSLLSEKNKTATELAIYLDARLPNISNALNNKRAMPMNYIFEIAKFFKVEAKSLTIENNTKTTQLHANTKG